MEEYVSQSFDKNYAAAWSADQGGFSYGLAQNLLEYLKQNKIEVKTALDVCCGTGEMLNQLAKQGITCFGTEVAKSMVEYCTNKYPNMKFAFAKNIYDIPLKNKVNLITCNHDMINMMERFDGWRTLFANAFKALEKKGVFMFDFLTKKKLENWNEVIYEQSDAMDHVKSVSKGMDNKCIMNDVYYIKDNDGLYQKTFDIVVESYYETKQITDALAEAGFKRVLLCDFSLAPTNPALRNRIHVLAFKD